VKHSGDKSKLEDIFKIISKSPGPGNEKKTIVEKPTLSDIRTHMKNIANKGKNHSVTTR